MSDWYYGRRRGGPFKVMGVTLLVVWAWWFVFGIALLVGGVL